MQTTFPVHYPTPNLTKQEQLDLAIRIAVHAHAGQLDKGGKPYILHPLHLMNQMMFDLQLAAIAVLHDVIEDTNEESPDNLEFDDLVVLGFSPRVIAALRKLTHEKGVPYDVYIEEICSNYDAIRVKRKDLKHNSDITRLKGVRPKDLERIEKYHRAYVRLTKAKRDFERK